MEPHSQLSSLSPFALLNNPQDRQQASGNRVVRPIPFHELSNMPSVLPPFRPQRCSLPIEADRVALRELSGLGSFNSTSVDMVEHSMPPHLSLSGNRELTESMPTFNLRPPLKSMTFDELCSDPTVRVRPKQMGFIPHTAWTDEPISFGLLVTSFFRRRNSVHSKFPYKLLNALRLCEKCPDFIPHVGVQWITDSIFRVERNVFAKLLGVKTVEGGLFHQQGNFPSHGFMEFPYKESNELSIKYGYGPVDLSVHRFLEHSSKDFNRYSTEQDILQCKWLGHHGH